ncbi:hypothetical protein XELAEV_18003287mg, partial [Xenopus laevis]
GHKRQFTKPDSRRPISADQLRRLISSLSNICFSKYEEILFKTTFVLSFFAAFRLGELVAENKKSVSSLRVGDVMLGLDKVKIFIRRSKTDQFQKGCIVCLQELQNSSICPVRSVKEFLLVRPVGSISFLIHEDFTPVTRFQFSRILKLCVEKCGFGNLNLTPHSFRIGAATEADNLGLDESVIKRLGRWNSGRFKLYSSKKTVWIVGHSFVCWAEERAVRRPYTSNLLDPCKSQVFWFGRRGMKWADLWSAIWAARATFPKPDIIIVHLGGNDIGKVKTLDLINFMKRDLTQLRLTFNDVLVVFSEVIQRLVWVQFPYLKPLERVRKKINRALFKFMPLLGGFSFRHTELEDGCPGLYRDDLVHLSGIGLDILNSDFQDMVERAAWLVEGPFLPNVFG